MSRVNKYDELKISWEEKREKLSNSEDLWLEVFDDIFIERLNHYFFNPAQLLLYGGSKSEINKKDERKIFAEANGNGFAVIMILTSLIESIESIYSKVINTKYNNELYLKNFQQNQNYCKKIDNKDIFKNFFKDRFPFNKYNEFWTDNNTNFYNFYRNSLFHGGLVGRDFKIRMNTEKEKAIGLRNIRENEKQLLNGKKWYELPNLDNNFKIIEGNIIFREFFYYAFRYELMKDLRDKFDTEESVKFSLARNLDVLFCEGDYNQLDFTKNWWK